MICKPHSKDTGSKERKTHGLTTNKTLENREIQEQMQITMTSIRKTGFYCSQQHKGTEVTQSIEDKELIELSKKDRLG